MLGLKNLTPRRFHSPEGPGRTVLHQHMLRPEQSNQAMQA